MSALREGVVMRRMHLIFSLVCYNTAVLFWEQLFTDVYLLFKLVCVNSTTTTRCTSNIQFMCAEWRVSVPEQLPE